MPLPNNPATEVYKCVGCGQFTPRNYPAGRPEERPQRIQCPRCGGDAPITQAMNTLEPFIKAYNAIVAAYIESAVRMADAAGVAIDREQLERDAKAFADRQPL